MIGHILAKYLNINIVTRILFFRSKPGLALHLKRRFAPHSNEIIALHNLLDYFDVLFVSNRDRWHSHVVYMPNLVFHQRSQRRYGNENTGTTRLFEQRICSDRKALENQRFAVACPRNSRSAFSCSDGRLSISNCSLTALNAFCQHSSVVADILFPTQSRFDV